MEQKPRKDISAQFGRILEVLHEGYILVDEDAKIHDVNPAYCKMVGYSREELLEMDLHEVRPGMTREYQRDFIEKALKEGSVEFETQHRTKSGEMIDLEASAATIEHEGKIYLVGLVRDVTDAKRKEREIEESWQMFRSLFEHNPHPVYYFDLEGNFQGVNDKLVEFTGYSREELLQMSFERFIVEEDLERTIEQFKKAASGEAGQYEIKVKVKGGSRKDIRVSKFPMYVGDEITGVFGILQDITEHKKAARKLRESEQRFRTMFENNPHSVFYFDRQGKFLGANKKFEELSGYTEKKLKEKTFEEFIHPDDLDRTWNYFQKGLAGEVQQYEITGVRRNGEERQVFITNFPYMKDGECVGLFGICEDITVRKAANIRLKRSEQRFKSLFERNPDAVYSFDAEGKFLMANQALEELTGYDIEELKELNFEPLVAPEDRERVWGHFQKALKGTPQNYTASGIHKEGYRFEVQVTNLPIYVDGTIEGVFGIAHDITEEREARRKLKESEERWQRLLENNPQPVQIVQEGRIVFINEVGAQFYGASSPEELIGKPILDFTHPEYMEKMLERKRKLEQDVYIEPDAHKIVLLNGEERYIEAHSIPIQYMGEPAIQTVIHDITDLKQQQDIIEKSLKEKEVLLQEIHHRVKNNLAVISGLLELQAMNLDDESSISALRDSQIRIHSMAMIHEKLYQSEALSDIGFDEYLKELVETIGSTYNSQSRSIQTAFDMDSFSLNIDEAIPCSLIINEVIVNCYKHAFDSIGKGRIDIRLEYDEPTVTMKITDDGKGLADGFKAIDQQSLGMTLIESLSRQLEGTFRFESNPETGGTQFFLRFEKGSTV